MIDFIFDTNGAMWVKRPHEHKVGDIVELDIVMQSTGKQDIKLAKSK